LNREHHFSFVISLAHFFWILLDVTALHDSRESICQLVHHDLRQIVAGHTRDVAVTHTVFGYKDIVAQACGIACSRGNADVCLRAKSVLLATINSLTTATLHLPYTQSTQSSTQHHSPNTPANPYPQRNSGGSSRSPSLHLSAPTLQTLLRALSLA